MSTTGTPIGQFKVEGAEGFAARNFVLLSTSWTRRKLGEYMRFVILVSFGVLTAFSALSAPQNEESSATVVLDRLERIEEMVCGIDATIMRRRVDTKELEEFLRWNSDDFNFEYQIVPRSF